MPMLVAACVCAVLATVRVPQAAQAAATLDDRVYAVARQLMCPTCAGQTVAESNAPLAQQMRAVIRERLQRGESPEQIRAFFVSQFGDSVLAAPPTRGVGLVLWVVPLVALLVGVSVLALFMRRTLSTPARVP